MVVNFNEEWTTRNYRELSRRLTSERRKQLEEKTPSIASMLIVTPFDKQISEWTLGGPPPFVLSRLVAVSKATLCTGLGFWCEVMLICRCGVDGGSVVERVDMEEWEQRKREERIPRDVVCHMLGRSELGKRLFRNRSI